MSDNVYVGDSRRLEARFFNFDGDATDPTTVTLTIVDPSGNSSTPATTNDTALVGGFYYDLDVDEAGIWQFSYNGAGNGVDRTEFDSFTAIAKPFG
jgi:hypothetical protein